MSILSKVMERPDKTVPRPILAIANKRTAAILANVAYRPPIESLSIAYVQGLHDGLDAAAELERREKQEIK